MAANPVRLVRVPALAADVPYAYAAVVEPPRTLVVTAGSCPLDADGRVVAVGDVIGQTEQALQNLAVTLTEAGVGLTDVVKTTVHVASPDRVDLATAWAIVARWFGEHDAPSTLLGVAVLGYPDQLVEVEAIAAVADPTRTPPHQPT